MKGTTCALILFLFIASYASADDATERQEKKELESNHSIVSASQPGEISSIAPSPESRQKSPTAFASNEPEENDGAKRLKFLLDQTKNRVAILEAKAKWAENVDSQIRDDMWNLHGGLVAIFALMTLLGVVFQIGRNIMMKRENALSELIENEKKAELERTKVKLTNAFENAVKSMQSKANMETDIFKHHLGLQHMLTVNQIDQQIVYSSVRSLGQTPRAYLLPTFAKLLEQNLDQDVRDAVLNALNGAKTLLDSSIQDR